MKIAQSLWAAEDAIDTALAKAAQFNGTLVTARSEANLSAIVGQEAFEVSASAFAALAKARADIVEAHKRLSETKLQVGLRTFAAGDEQKPDFTGTGTGAALEPHLKAVA